MLVVRAAEFIAAIKENPKALAGASLYARRFVQKLNSDIDSFTDLNMPVVGEDDDQDQMEINSYTISQPCMKHSWKMKANSQQKLSGHDTDDEQEWLEEVLDATVVAEHSPNGEVVHL
eukprot:gnl/TRDRNA2_/TRDRNA2_101329_c0_seq1.p1 gnl/TRDRNA2_/TRDRNA2_101329_c0~~gnl/TRDRNA2_/TRDRNA2_101329_c0_seq1.p1  ORF type:complete len:129 (+),score=29.55 gnl/TRDRNA2_/TRDRNA2_101329_c0_seq1:34-387(+)